MKTTRTEQNQGASPTAEEVSLVISEAERVAAAAAAAAEQQAESKTGETKAPAGKRQRLREHAPTATGAVAGESRAAASRTSSTAARSSRWRAT